MGIVEHQRLADNPMVGDGWPDVTLGPSLSHALVDRPRRFLLQAVIEPWGLATEPATP